MDSIYDILLMRQELGLVAVVLILLVADIFSSESHRSWFRPLSAGLMAVMSVVAFLPSAEGELFGGMYQTSPMREAMKGVLCLATAFIFLQAGDWLKRDKLNIREREFYVLTVATLLGMSIMISAGNFMILYVGMELASLPMACLIAWDKYHEKSAEAGAKYILLSVFASGVMMFGMSYLYGATGTLYFDDMITRIEVNAISILGFVLFLAGIGFKVSIVPFHQWAADVYEGAPTGVTTYLSVVSKGAGIFTLLITLHHIFEPLGNVWHHTLWVLAILTITIGNLFALRQKDIKRFFAYSSISQAGYLLLGLIAGTRLGVTSTVYYLAAYMFSNLAAFGVITAIENHTGRTDIAAYSGLRRSNPRLAFTMMLALFSLAGIPPLAGFFGKLFIFMSIADTGEYILLFIALANTVISLYYYLLIIREMFISPETAIEKNIPVSGYNRASLVICSIAIVVMGLIGGVYGFFGTLAF